MHFLCTLLVPRSLSAATAARIREVLTASGWEAAGSDALVFSVPADPLAVDGPAVKLGGVLRELCDLGGPFVESAALTLCCRLGTIDVFTEVVRVGVRADTRVGMTVNPDVPPVFGDRIRLRDKMLDAAQRAGGVR